MTSNIIFRHICREDTYMFNYTQLPDELFTIEQFAVLSLHAKVLYSFMLRRVSISKDNGWVDEIGDIYIYYRVDEIMQKFNCSNKTAAKIMSELEEIGLIEKKRQGQGKPDIIYVNKSRSVINEQKSAEEEPALPIEQMEHMHDRSDTADAGESVPDSEVKNIHFKKCKKFTSKDVKNSSLEVKNVHASYKENNYKESDISSSLSPPNIQQKQVRLNEEEEERYKEQIRYQEAERRYTARIAEAVYAELLKRQAEYLKKFTADMFQRVCKSVAVSKEPILSMPGFVNWCLDRISFQPTARTDTNQFCQFMKRNDYDFAEIEKELAGR